MINNNIENKMLLQTSEKEPVLDFHDAMAKYGAKVKDNIKEDARPKVYDLDFEYDNIITYIVEEMKKHILAEAETLCYKQAETPGIESISKGNVWFECRESIFLELKKEPGVEYKYAVHRDYYPHFVIRWTSCDAKTYLQFMEDIKKALEKENIVLCNSVLDDKNRKKRFMVYCDDKIFGEEIRESCCIRYYYRM